MLYVIERNPLASCGFIGTPKPGEEKATTQRYRIYTRMMNDFFPQSEWHHEDFGGESAYLLFNRRALAQDPDLLRHAAAMFDALNRMPGGLHPPPTPPEPAGVGWLALPLPPFFPPMTSRIAAALAALETRADIRILLAVESGSRAWGFASPDSDFDVRLVYCHRPAWYLTLDEGRDTVEQPVDELLDLSGWELRKFLRLLRAGNATPAEWLQSPMVYHEAPGAANILRELLPATFNPRPILHHYLGMVRRGIEEDLVSDAVRLKRLFYALRAGLAARWARRRGTVPPLTLADLRAELPPTLASELDALLAQKLVSEEKTTVPRPAAIADFLAEEYAAGRAAQTNPAAFGKAPVGPDLDAVFQGLLHSAFSNIL